ncbi:hypothetical protein HGRIS_003573 [Hohenbuehelia grisea]|uniref:Peptidase C14 caspase domain-containing protein n=1 Tax=Hohenbuehelia grisea TaxID=104357 RepID=A0ABR3JGR8_9AGAR
MKPEISPSSISQGPLHENDGFWALVIGINEYEKLESPLKGAVADTEDVVKYLRDTLRVPDRNIKCLHDKEATRQEILRCLTEMVDDSRINPGDAILIYYAGHGAQCRPPQEWPTDAAYIQMICPYNFDPNPVPGDEDAQGILDVVIGKHLSELAEAKLNNITVILDSCYSGSATRGGLLARGVKLSPEYQLHTSAIPDNVSAGTTTRGANGNRKLQYADMGSHVLLAACSERQLAHESQGRGRFTSVLMNYLRSVKDISTLTYEQVVTNLPPLTDARSEPIQSPQCVGSYKSARLFSSRALTQSRGRLLYRVLKLRESIKLEAGQVQGVTEGAIFEVYGTEKPDADLVCTITVEKATDCESVMAGPRDKMSKISWALQVRAGSDAAVDIALDDSADLQPIRDSVARAMEPGSGKCIPRLVGPDHQHEVAIFTRDGNAYFKITDPICVSKKFDLLPRHIPVNATERLCAFPQFAASFFYHLRRPYPTERLSQYVTVEAFELEDTGGATLNPKRVNGQTQNLIREGIMEVTMDPQDAPASARDGDSPEEEFCSDDDEESAGKLYGFKISSSFEQPLYIWIFSFDVGSLEIRSLYEPPSAGNNKTADPSIFSGGSFTAGYGTGDVKPQAYFVTEGLHTEVTYLKVFFSTKYLNLGGIAQPSAFDAPRYSKDMDVPKGSFFTTKTLAIVTHRE